MSEDITKDYAEMLGVLAMGGVRAGIWGVKEVQRSYEAIRKRLEKAVKPADWAPRDKDEWKHHTAVKNPEGKTIGYADTNDGLVATMEAKDLQEGVERKPKMLNIAGSMWLAAQTAEASRELDVATPTSAQHAHAWLEDNGWTVMDGQREAPDAAGAADVDPAAVGQIDGPVLVTGGSVDVPEGAREVVVTGGEATVPEGVPVQVPGAARINGEQVSGWDEVAEDFDSWDAPAPDPGMSREEEHLIAAGPVSPEPPGAQMSR